MLHIEFDYFETPVFIVGTLQNPYIWGIIHILTEELGIEWLFYGVNCSNLRGLLNRVSGLTQNMATRDAAFTSTYVLFRTQSIVFSIAS